MNIKSFSFGPVSDRKIFLSFGDGDIYLEGAEIVYFQEFLRQFLEKNPISLGEFDPKPENVNFLRPTSFQKSANDSLS